MTEQPPTPQRDMFGASGFGDTSGFGGLAVREQQLVSSPKPYGGWFDAATDALEQAYPQFSDAISGVSGVDYPNDPTGRRLHAVYHLLSMTYRRRLRLEVAVSDADPHVPSATGVYPGANWHERETWDFFGIVFDGHPALTRIQMPDDWPGHPQRKDYPLGGVPVEYKGAQIPPPDERRSYA
jgi:NADH-quinone oxidoreductase subunit C